MLNEDDDKLIKKIVRSEWSQIFTVIIAVSGMFFWSVSITHSTVEAIRQDIKDFHGRLCTLEEKYYQMREDKK
jgi:hypothetical protein